MKKWGMMLLVFLMACSLALAGCSKEETSAADTLEKAVEASKDLKSYSFSGELQLNMNPSEEMLAADESLAMAASMLSNSKLVMSGVYQADPMMAEMTLEAQLSGDFAMNLSLPMVMTEQKMWIKVPNIPMLAGFIPEEMVGKFIELDYAELAEMSGEEIPATTMDIQTQQALGMELLKVITDNTQEEEYFTNVSKKDAGLPEDVKAEDIVKFSLTNEDIDPFAKTLIKTILPQMLDVLAKPEYKDIMQMEASEIEELKADMEMTDAEIQEGIDELKKVISINDLSWTMALDKDHYPTYQKMVGDVKFTDEGQSMDFAVNLSMSMTDVNEDPAFTIGEPAADQIITMDELNELFYMGY